MWLARGWAVCRLFDAKVFILTKKFVGREKQNVWRVSVCLLSGFFVACAVDSGEDGARYAVPGAGYGAWKYG